MGRHAAILGALVALVFACGGIDDNELHCEEAVAHLAECCDGFDEHRFTCVEDGCNSSSPDFFDSASACIRSRTCDELRDQGKCAAFVKLANEPYPSNNQTRIDTEACK